jgi:hypothetical protein
MMLRLALPLVLTLLLAPAFTAPAAAAEPSFDCRTAKTARELATCNDAKPPPPTASSLPHGAKRSGVSIL